AWAWPLHEPVFRAALSQGMALHGGNLVRGQSMQLFKKGESTLPEKLQGLLSKAPLEEPSLQALNKALVDGHCGQLPEAMLEPMRLVQRATDLALLVTATDYTPAIVIAGNGHVRKDFGIPSLVPAFQRPVRLVTVGFVESELSVDKASMNAAAGVRNDPAWAIYDYVWITPAAEREDPCKGFQMPKR
ncbi:MAG: ChaN family lipoprotein, partial [Burkholderiaceae bacterium]